MAKVQIKNKERVRFYNMQKEDGDLDRARETRIIRYELIDKLSDQQKTDRGISLNVFGVYVVSEEKADDVTEMTLTDESLDVFKTFVARTSDEHKVFYLDEPLFRQILEMQTDK